MNLDYLHIFDLCGAYCVSGCCRLIPSIVPLFGRFKFGLPDQIIVRGHQVYDGQESGIIESIRKCHDQACPARERALETVYGEAFGWIESQIVRLR